MRQFTDPELARLIESAKLAETGAGREWDQLARFYATVREHYSGDPSLTFGNGETVPPSYVQMRARTVFFQTLHRLVPESTQALLTEEAYGIVAEINRAIRQWGGWIQGLAFIGKLDPHATFRYPPLAAALQRQDAHIRRWQDTHNLPYEWIADAAQFTMNAAAAMRDDRQTYSFPLSVADPDVTVHDGRRRRHPEESIRTSDGKRPSLEARKVWADRFVPTHRLIHVPIYLDDLADLSQEYDSSGCVKFEAGYLGTFDVRTQTIDEAVAEVLPGLVERLRAALQTIKDEDRVRAGARDPVKFEDARPFEWAVRVQVLGERRSDIAKAAGLSPDRVRKAVRELGNLMGMAFRADPSGRKPGSYDTRPRHIGDRM